jgi:hypothetical protein
MDTVITHGDILRWLIWIVVGVAATLVTGMAGLIKLMVVSRFTGMNAQMTAGFLQVDARQNGIESKLDEIHKELNSKIDGVKEEVHVLDKRLVVMEAEHKMLSQGGYSHCRHDDETNGGN